jgi:hypothetical protein
VAHTEADVSKRANTEKPAAEWVEIGQLVPWDENPRHNDGAVEEVAASIRRFGFASPIIARTEDRMVIAGHTRLKAAQLLGLDRVPVRYMDLDPADAKLLAIADNKVGEIAEWDDAKLAEVLHGLQMDGRLDDLTGLGMSPEEVAELSQEMPEIDLDGLSDSTDHLNGESEFCILRMSIRKEDQDEVEQAAKADWGDPEVLSGQADRIGALFLHLWRTHGGAL